MKKTRQCEICGNAFEIIDHGWTRKYCYACAPHEDKDHTHADMITIKRRSIKQMLIDRAGGKCVKCGYDKCARALEFHHIDPNEKDFGVSRILTKNIQSQKQEADKCILLCSNCHAEEHQKLFEQGYEQFNLDL